VVVPFRRRHPLYQRQWRLVSKFREIRDEIAIGAQLVGERLTRLVGQGGRLQRGADEPAQVRAKTGAPLTAALAAAAAIASALGALVTQVSALSLLG
jgi:hypothetical protein